MNQNDLPPNSNFSSDFGHFILEILENLKVFTNIQKISLKNRDFWGDIPPEFRTGGTCPRHPPGGDAHVHKLRFDFYSSAGDPFCLHPLVAPPCLSYAGRKTVQVFRPEGNRLSDEFFETLMAIRCNGGDV